MTHLSLLKPFLTNISITALSSILPIAIALLLCPILKDHSNGDIYFKIIKYLTLVPESICPVIAIPLLSFAFSGVTPYWVAILCFTFCFIGYIPSRYSKSSSLPKNIILNALGLVSTIYKWSFCASTIGVFEMFSYTNLMIKISHESLHHYLIDLAISFAVIFVLKLIKQILYDVME